MKGFTRFLREHGVITLTIGFALGGSVSKLVTAFVNDIINPIFGLVFEKVGSLSKSTLTLGPVVLKWGDFVSVLINFFIMAFTVYLLFKWIGLIEHKSPPPVLPKK